MAFVGGMVASCSAPLPPAAAGRRSTNSSCELRASSSSRRRPAVDGHGHACGARASSSFLGGKLSGYGSPSSPIPVEHRRARTSTFVAPRPAVLVFAGIDQASGSSSHAPRAPTLSEPASRRVEEDRLALERNFVDQGLGPLLEAARALPLPSDPGAIITVADYAKKTGLNSVEAIGAVAAVLRSRCPNPILCLHADSPGHDFGTLAAALGAPTAYPQRLAGVHAAIVPRSLHGSCAPAGTVDLALCSTSIHWLSRAPLPAASSFDFEELRSDERAAVEAQAAEDWETFLARRAEELRPGGALLLIAGTGAAPPGLSIESLETRQTNTIGSFQAAAGLAGPGPYDFAAAAARMAAMMLAYAGPILEAALDEGRGPEGRAAALAALKARVEARARGAMPAFAALEASAPTPLRNVSLLLRRAP
eukprot:tig00000654_g2805.t1